MSGYSAGPPEIVLDLSRLLSRIHHKTPTGVDRVEMAYARELLRLAPDRLAFGAVHPTGFYGRIPDAAARAFLDRTDADWRRARERRSGRADTYARLIADLWLCRPRSVQAPSRPRVYLQVSPHHLDDTSKLRRVIRKESAKFVCLLHDLIPIEYPEYARIGGNATHERRIRNVATLADAVIANSEATRRSFLPYLDEARRSVPVHTVHLGLDVPETVRAAPAERPYFVCVSTIEPRKNHLLLLNIWRRLSEMHGAANIPRLVLIGRRGWENEQIVDMLDRCTALRGCVEEHSGLADDAAFALIAGARALLLPSFAEGYGMPVPEALAIGVPVLCSDLPALREAGGDVPDYLDPLDGPGWMRAILDYVDRDSVRAAAQARRMEKWQAPDWAGHVRRVVTMVEGMSG